MTEPPAEEVDWLRVEELFHRLSSLPRDRRKEEAEALCGDDAALLEEVLALLEASEDTTARVDGAIHGTLEAWLEAEEGTLDGAPERLGPFRLVRKISEGGQAVVYLAERLEPYRQQVAIKLLKRGMDTDEILRRLQLERQILAQLEHPNIARLLDGGSSPDGRPYFALEYIDGEPIDQFCDRERLGIAERLRLFRQACSAVQTAHARLVIHRDLKPSNLLVTKDGEPKLLDFGIAKLLETSPLDATVAHTRTGVRWMTPDFAAPEQVFDGPLTTAVDVYALGVMLYKLLTGELPRRYPTHQPQDIERTLDQRLEPPSVRVARVADEQAADRRGTTVDRLARSLRGDLDTIVAKALRPEPERRYASVEQMAQDIDRHLRSEPVLARGDTWTYRWSKFVRRHRTGVGAMALVFLSLVAGVVGTTRAMRVAEAQRELAEQRLGELEAVMGFTTGMFEIADPGESRGSRVTVREILDQGAGRIEGELADQPAIAARLMTTMGAVYRNLGLYSSAADLLQHASDRWNAVDDHQPEWLDSRRRWAAVMIDQGRFEEARELLEAVSREEKKILPPDDPAVAETLHLIGLAVQQLEGGEAAEPYLRRALDLRLELLGEDHLDVAESRNDLGQLLSARNDLAAAESLYRKALAVRRARLGEGHPGLVETHHNLATVLEKRGELEAAEEQITEVLRMRRAVLGDRHRDVAVSLNTLSQIQSAAKRHEEAERTLRQALDIADETLGDHPTTLSILNNLALELKDLGRPEEAVELMYDMETMYRNLSGGTASPLVAQARFNTALLLLEVDRKEEAVELLRSSIRILRELGMDREAPMAYPLTLLAEQLALAGKCSEARPMIRRALELRDDLPAEDSRRRRSEEVAALCDESPSP